MGAFEGNVRDVGTFTKHLCPTDSEAFTNASWLNTRTAMGDYWQ
jgi:hypothetical protein